MHTLEGNKTNNKLRLGWWNNKSSQSHSAKSTRNQVAQALKKYNLDILSISEANVFKEDEPSEVKIAGYDLVCDNLLESGRTRSAMYVSQKLQYQLRQDLMDRNVPEVWIEVSMKKRKKGEGSSIEKWQ